MDVVTRGTFGWTSTRRDCGYVVVAAKAMRIAAVSSSAVEAGMKEYPFKKAKGALRNFSEGEIELLSKGLLSLYHEGHQGLRDMELALEEWVLTV